MNIKISIILILKLSFNTLLTVGEITNRSDHDPDSHYVLYQDSSTNILRISYQGSTVTETLTSTTLTDLSTNIYHIVKHSYNPDTLIAALTDVCDNIVVQQINLTRKDSVQTPQELTTSRFWSTLSTPLQSPHHSFEYIQIFEYNIQYHSVFTTVQLPQYNIQY